MGEFFVLSGLIQSCCYDSSPLLRNNAPPTSMNDSRNDDVTAPPTIAKRKGHVRSSSDIVVSERSGGGVNVGAGLNSSGTLSRATTASYATTRRRTDLNKRKSFLDEGFVPPKTECFFPQPVKGQSLTSFLSSDDFHTCAELDRENAHFYICEALISAVEQIKCNQIVRQNEEELEDESDEEIAHLKQRIRIRRKEREREKVERQHHHHMLSDGRTDTTTSSPLSSTYSGSSQPNSTSNSDDDSVEEFQLCDGSDTLSSLQDRGLSLSMASLYSDADVKRFQSSTLEEEQFASPNNAAESVALCLLGKFSKRQLPKASDLEWLVSEQDAPQRLLPLPDSWPVSPDQVEEEISMQRTRLRGTMDWAPPRPQIIFNVHPTISRKSAIAKQKFRCAGCGMRVDVVSLSKFRLCHYLSKYFCQCCHANSMSPLPSHVIHKWDFTRYRVSNFSRDLLDQMEGDPIFNVEHINAAIFNKSRPLDKFRKARWKLYHAKQFIGACKMAQNLQVQLKSLESHWICEPEFYSLRDFIQVRNGKLVDELERLSFECIDHITNCLLCASRGSFCEICPHASDAASVIFPFQLEKVTQCQKCGACFHKKCFKPQNCPKCKRIQMRKQRSNAISTLSDDD